jgi:uroporphyrinogen decarboxylase
MHPMTSRERVLAAASRQPTDRVPVGHMAFSPGVAQGVRRLLGASAEADLDLLLGIDLRGIMPAYIGPEFSFKPANNRRHFFGSSHKSYADNLVERPLHHAETIQDVEAFRWPTVADHDFSEIERLYSYGSDYALAGPGWTPTFSQLCELFGMETALFNLLDKPALIEAAAEHITNLVCDLGRGLHRATHGNMLIFKTSDDLATQRGLMFRPELWRKLFKPRLARQFQVGKELGLLNMIHACGDISAILPDLVDIGLDILEPTQAHLPGMRPEWLKREFGAHLTFFGAISTQTTIPYGAPEEVRQEVRERIRILGAGGGYIVSPDHEVLEGMPSANVVALYEAAGSLNMPS